MTAALDIDALRLRCWMDGDLSYLLHEGQVEIRRAFYEYGGRVLPILAGRRYGKSFLGCVLAVEQCASKPGSIVRVGAATGKMVKQIILPHLAAIHADAPEGYRPTYRQQDGIWEYPNGSILQAAGCDNQGADKLRGTEMDLGVVEEAGFIRELRYLVQDVLLPQTITTNGKIIMPTSPPRSPAHDVVGYITQAEAGGYLIRRKTADAPHVTPAMLEEYMRESGGELNSTWRREYECEIVVDDTLAVIPEFTQHEGAIVQERERPDYCDRYVVADFGFHDLTAVLFAYYDFAAGLVVVEDELTFQHTTSGTIIPAIRDKERELWGSESPYRRLCDADAFARADMVRSHNYPWGEVKKDNKEAGINNLRLAVAQHTLRIHPRCRTLRAHLRHAIWNKGRTTFERSGEFGHFDSVDAAVYLLRGINKGRNPFPALQPGVSLDTHHIRPEAYEPRGSAKLAQEIFRGKRRRR